MKYKIIPLPVGALTIVVENACLAAVLWDKERPNRVRLGPMTEDRKDPLLLETERQLQEYFSGIRKVFDLPLKPRGTPFQENIWNLLNEIPYGATATYGEMAAKIGQPQASRAVGAAIGRNPISIITPCHRVIAANGSLTGFAGGLERKRLLLEMEAGKGL